MNNVKHYILENDKKNPLPDLQEIYSKIHVKYLSPEYEHMLQENYVFGMKTTEETLIPEILTSPFLMVKRELFQVIMMYMPDVKVKYISFIDYEREIYETYIVPVLEVIEYEMLPKTDISEKVLFYVSSYNDRYAVARLDLSESILRRNSIGLKVKEFIASGEA